MKRGIYIVANDKVAENAIALLNSIRLYDPDIPVILIPFNDSYHRIAETLSQQHGVQVFPNLELIDQLTQTIGNIFDKDFLALPNKMRKFAVWFGPLDEFIYIDTDIVVFEKISDTLNYLSDFDFLCCDYHFSGEGIRNIFSPVIQDQGIFTPDDLQDVFNSGFWASRTGLFTEAQLYDTLRECAAHREYFDFTQGVTDQPLLNYLMLQRVQRRGNLVKPPYSAPGSWAGSKHFQERDHILYDNDKQLKYLHWAGTPMRPGGPYRALWEYYRYLGESPPSTPSWGESIRRRLSTFARGH